MDRITEYEEIRFVAKYFYEAGLDLIHKNFSRSWVKNSQKKGETREIVHEIISDIISEIHNSSSY